MKNPDASSTRKKKLTLRTFLGVTFNATKSIASITLLGLVFSLLVISTPLFVLGTLLFVFVQVVRAALEFAKD